MKAIVLALAVSIVSGPGSAFSQEGFPVFLEGTVGLYHSDKTVDYRNGYGRALDALVGVRVRSVAGGVVVLAVAGSVHERGDYTSECRPAPSGCARVIPDFRAAAALVGIQSGGGGLRIMAGPATVRGEARNEPDDRVLAWAGRIEAAANLHRHVALVGSLRGLVIPDYNGDRFRLSAFGVGLRLM